MELSERIRKIVFYLKDRNASLRAVTKAAGSDIRTVKKDLVNLEAMGIVQCSRATTETRTFYSYSLTPQYKAILSKREWKWTSE